MTVLNMARKYIEQTIVYGYNNNVQTAFNVCQKTHILHL